MSVDFYKSSLQSLQKKKELIVACLFKDIQDLQTDINSITGKMIEDMTLVMQIGEDQAEKVIEDVKISLQNLKVVQMKVVKMQNIFQS
jgi:hypothetical protein